MKTFDYKYDDLFSPTIQAIHNLGGSATNYEIEEQVASLLNLADEEVEDIHRGNTTKLSYRLAWARNYLKRLGLVENSRRAVWTLTPKGIQTKEIDQQEAKRIVRELSGTKANDSETKGRVEISGELDELVWEDELISVLKNIEPDAFERLCQRFLRELGFINVEVTGKSGDGGIDGVGVLKIGGVLSFHVVFQCKRYAGSVATAAIRDFRGAMIGRADKGIFITTGTFTRDAKQEAQRDGASPVDLIDGNALAAHLKNLGLGVEVKTREEVTINRSWFDAI